MFGQWRASVLEAQSTALLGIGPAATDLLPRYTEAQVLADIGPGTYTMMTQLAAEMLGVPLDNVTAKLGDSALPDAPVEGGSFTTSSVGSAVQAACRSVQEELLGLAQKMAGSPLMGAEVDDVVFADGKIRRKDNEGREVSVADVMRPATLTGSKKKPAPSRRVAANTRTSPIRRYSPRSGSTSNSASSGSPAWSTRWRPAVFSIRRLRAARFLEPCMPRKK